MPLMHVMVVYTMSDESFDFREGLSRTDDFHHQ
jgi:hypothetical protein